MPPPQERLGGPGLAAAILIGATAISAIGWLLAEWNDYDTGRDFLAGHAGMSAVYLADRWVRVLAVVYIACYVAAAVLFLVWLWPARANAERICHGEHRRARGWVIGAWFCPTVNLIFPAMIVEDVYRASLPSTRSDHIDLRALPAAWPVRGWWALWVASTLITWYGLRQDVRSLDDLRASDVVDTLSTALQAGAAAMIIAIMYRISGWQAQPKAPRSAGLISPA